MNTPERVILLPWEAEPYKLHSWWDMERFSAAAFQHMASFLAEVGRVDDKIPLDTKAGELAVKIIPSMTEILKDCEKLKLQVSMACIDEFIAYADLLTVGEMAHRLQVLNETIRREMQTYMFFHMPSKQAGFYRQRTLFGERVDSIFFSTQFDITEAGNCYAMGRGTACVFHLMRVMEVGVQQFGYKLGVPLAAEKNWQVILDLVNKAIKARPPKDDETIALSQVAAHLYNVKLAWRNQVMHPHDKYTLDEAEDVLTNVSSFMKSLAELMPVPKLKLV